MKSSFDQYHVSCKHLCTRRQHILTSARGAPQKSWLCTAHASADSRRLTRKERTEKIRKGKTALFGDERKTSLVTYWAAQTRELTTGGNVPADSSKPQQGGPTHHHRSNPQHMWAGVASWCACSSCSAGYHESADSSCIEGRGVLLSYIKVWYMGSHLWGQLCWTCFAPHSAWRYLACCIRSGEPSSGTTGAPWKSWTTFGDETGVSCLCWQ